MLRALQAFLKNPAPTRAQAAGALRTLFLLAFAGQTALAFVAWAGLSLAFAPTPAPSPLVPQMLLAVAGLELPAALLLAALIARSGEQPGALTAALLQGILLATPTLFALFAWLIGAPARYTALLLGLSALYYVFGLLLVGRYAQQATLKPAKSTETP